MSISTPIDPRTVWPLAYLSGRLGYRLAGYGIDSPGKDVISADLEREDGTRVHVDWFPRSQHIVLSQTTGLLGIYGTFAEMADVLEHL